MYLYTYIHIMFFLTIYGLGAPSSFSGHSKYDHSNRSEILHRSIKKNHQKKLKIKKVRDTFRKISKFFEIFDFLKIFEKFKIFRKLDFSIFKGISKKIKGFSKEFQRKISKKFKKSKISKIFEIFRKVSLTFLIFKNFR